ncbi:MAG: hypothetical protein M5U26_26970 [Planctomycetota bacterium]|nr:hypothetical protein [Planctomycetota bacterium]
MRMRWGMFAALLPVLLPLWGGEGEAEPPEDPAALKPGVILPKVVTLHDPAQSYALYIPSYYTPEKKWPILYAFSPNAQGGTPVNLFRNAAEQFGWIVAGSNVARNGPYEPIRAASEALWKDTWARLALDETRLYATGFSGGARMACEMALERDKPFAGWIPCGAGFSSNVRPKEGDGLRVCALVGRQDFNFDEVQRMKRALERLKLPCRLTVFEGGHDWPPRKLAYGAVRYLDLAARCASPEPGGETLTAMLKEELAAARKLLDDPRLFMDGYRQLRDLQALAAKAPGVEAVAALAAEIEAAPKFKQELAAEDALNALRDELDELTDTHERFARMVEAYRGFGAKHPGTAAASLAQETLDGLPEQMAFAGRLLMRRMDFARAAVYLERALSLQPNPDLAYALACARARAGEKDAACAALEEAVQLGFRDGAHLNSNEDLAGLREEPRFKALAVKLAAAPPAAKTGP